MIAFGLPEGVLGIAWPSISDSFGVAITSLGGVVTAFTAGFTAVSFSTGWLLRKISLGLYLAIAALVAFSSYLSYTFVPEWWMLLIAAAGAGAGSGAIDTGLNVYEAINLNARLTNWIHAFFGLGSLAGSSLMTTLLVIGVGWQWGYGAVVFLFALLAIGFTVTRSRWLSVPVGSESPPRAAEGEGGGGGDVGSGRGEDEGDFGLVRTRDTLRVRTVWAGITAFLIYTALEVVAGVWSFTLLTEERGLSTALAGTWVASYFAGLFVGRIVIGAVAGRVSMARILRFSVVLSVIGALAFWQVGVRELNYVGLVLLGIGLGPIFPTLISATPLYAGAKHTPNAIGFQSAAAAIGAGLIPAGIGVIAVTAGLETISVSMVIGSLMLFGLLWVFSGRFGE